MRIRTLVKLFVTLLVLAGLYIGARFAFRDPVLRMESRARDWWNSPRVQSRIRMWDTLERDAITVHYIGVHKQKAEVIARVIEPARAELATRLGVKFPVPLNVYLFARPQDPVYYDTDGRTEILVSLPTEDDWMPAGFGGRVNHVGQLCYEVSLFANCFERDAPNFPETPFGEALATFVSWNYAVPAVYKEHRELAWAMPSNYFEHVNPVLYAQLAGQPPADRVEGHAWGPLDAFWLHFLQKHGPDQVAKVLTASCELMGDHTVDELAHRIETDLSDRDLASELRRVAGSAGP